MVSLLADLAGGLDSPPDLPREILSTPERALITDLVS
jgi:hypothetical protein